MPLENTSGFSEFLYRSLGFSGVLGMRSIGPFFQSIKKLVQRFTQEGLYEVLEYETTVELKDKEGERANVRKKEKVKYLQNNIYAFQDQAWGDGKILVDYRCSPGTPVDIYRMGYKNIVLISLRSVRNRGIIDEFNIEWKIRRGFLSSTGFWATEICHKTKHIKIHIIFPKTRPPVNAMVLEKNRQKNNAIGKYSFKEMPDGKWDVSWERNKPRLFEQYILKWEW